MKEKVAYKIAIGNFNHRSRELEIEMEEVEEE